MKKRQTIIAALVLALLLLVGGAIAYFTDTDSRTNEFTLGKVDIQLVEDAFETANATDIVPGQTIAKDPTVKNIGRNKAFVFLKVRVDCGDSGALFTYTTNEGWTQLSGSDECNGDGQVEKIYYYGSNNTLTELAVGASTPALFDGVTLISTLTSDVAPFLGDTNVYVDAYGIQSENLTAPVNPTTVWSNFSS